MIIVPDKTIAFIPLTEQTTMDISTFLRPLNSDHKRNWFGSNFYRCLPLAIGNMQGFVFSVPYDFTIFWNGGDNVDDLYITAPDYLNNESSANKIEIISEFGYGIFTAHFPFILKTPPLINLMTISPPNFPTPGISPMTGVVEADNLKFTFTLNFKVDIENTNITILKDTPILGIIPVPRYFCDSFELKNAYDIFDEKDVDKEIEICKKHAEIRNYNNMNGIKSDKIYYSGKDAMGNMFSDHQLPKKIK